MKSTVKSRLADLLKKHDNMSLYELSKRSGVGYKTIQRINSGETENPSKETLTPIAEALNANIEWLFKGVGDMNAKAERPTYKSPIEHAIGVLDDQLKKKDDVIQLLSSQLNMLQGMIQKAGLTFLQPVRQTGSGF